MKKYLLLMGMGIGLCMQTANAQKTLKVSAVQYPIHGAQSENQFLKRVEGYIISAKKEGASVVVLPELICLDLIEAGNSANEARQLQKIAREFSPRYFDWMKEKSKEFQITILGGSFPFEVDDEIRNIALMSFEDGTTYTQEKLFLTPDEIGWGWKPGHELKLFEHPTIGRFTIHICYDSEFPQMSTMIADFRPRVVFIPSMTGERGFNRVRWSAQARAVEH
jgi:predicted amidohydrolase